MSILEIVKAGPETTLQDRGRPGHRAVGIPQSGAADRLSFAIANHLAGNIWHAPALEITMGGLVVKALEDVQLAISGADMSARCDENLPRAINGLHLKRVKFYALVLPLKARAPISPSLAALTERFLRARARPMHPQSWAG